MYNIEYKVDEDIFNFNTPASNPFQAVKIFQENAVIFDNVQMLSLKKDECLRIF